MSDIIHRFIKWRAANSPRGIIWWHDYNREALRPFLCMGVVKMEEPIDWDTAAMERAIP
jgi:hypothetical protein